MGTRSACPYAFSCPAQVGGSTCFFFFSSRRRHTRSDRDWSSDVCSSDLAPGDPGSRTGQDDRTRAYLDSLPLVTRALAQVRPSVVVHAHTASSYANGFAKDRKSVV